MLHVLHCCVGSGVVVSGVGATDKLMNTVSAVSCLEWLHQLA